MFRWKSIVRCLQVMMEQFRITFFSFFIQYFICFQYLAVLSAQYNLTTRIRTQYLSIIKIETNETEKIKLNYSTVHDLHWTPNNDLISFVSDSNSKSTIILYSLKRKEYKSVVTYPLPIANMKWGNIGHVIVFSAVVYPGHTMQETKDIDEKKSANKSLPNALIYDELFVYHWDTYITEKKQHLHMVTVKINEENPFFYSFDENTIDIIGSSKGDAPTMPFGLIYNFILRKN